MPRLSINFGRFSKDGTLLHFYDLNIGNKSTIKSKESNLLLAPQTQTELLDESNINLGHESEGFSVYSDLKFLYQIGKICAESGKYLEEGILCLDDYINLLTFFNPSSSGNSYEGPTTDHPMYCKALYLVGLIFYKISDYEESERFLLKAKLYLFENKEMAKYYKCENMLAEVTLT
jgi:hypothetical protein